MLEENLYIKMLDDFCQTGKVTIPARPSNAKPWENHADALLNYLAELMANKHFSKQVITSQLRSRVFHGTVSKFIHEMCHFESFQNQRTWTERNKIKQLAEWSIMRKADRAAREKLLNSISEKHKKDGFDAEFFNSIFENKGYEDNANWDKLQADWQRALEHNVRAIVEKHVHDRKGNFELSLIKIMDQVTQYTRMHEIHDQQAAQAWDMMDGQWTETEFERKLKVVKLQDRYPEMQEIVNRMGRIANSNGNSRMALTAGHSMKMEHSSGSDIEGITVGNDLNALLPIELAEYVDDELDNLFLYKYQTRRLQTFNYKSISSKPVRKLGFTHASRKGPMIVCIDTSASMYGMPQRITTSLLSLLKQTAESLRRDCYLIDFSVSIRAIDLVNFNVSQSLSKQKTDAPFIGGGTSAHKLLECMFNLLDGKKQTSYINADVLWITDFLIPEPTAYEIMKLRDYRKTGTKLYGLRILSADNKQENTEWQSYFDRIYNIRYREVKRY